MAARDDDSTWRAHTRWSAPTTLLFLTRRRGSVRFPQARRCPAPVFAGSVSTACRDRLASSSEIRNHAPSCRCPFLATSPRPRRDPSRISYPSETVTNKSYGAISATTDTDAYWARHAFTATNKAHGAMSALVRITSQSLISNAYTLHKIEVTTTSTYIGSDTPERSAKRDT